nr:MAG TPA: hypothetical protein [Caudoviricetes sp.]
MSKINYCRNKLIKFYLHRLEKLKRIGRMKSSSM